MTPLGTHIIAELEGCSPSLLNDPARLEALIGQAVHQSGLELVRMISHPFQPVGVTVIAIISESHIAIHTYPEAGHASLDIFTCNPGSEASRRLLDFFLAALEPQESRIQTILRGEQRSASTSWMSSSEQ